MALFVEFKPILGEIAKYLRIIASKNASSVLASGTGATIPAGFHTVTITKTSAAGTVNITLPGGSVYALTREGEQFTVTGSSFGQFAIASPDAATWKWYAN